MRIAFHHENLFVRRRLGDDLPERIGDKGIAPKLQAMIGRPFESDAIYRRDINSVRYRVRPLMVRQASSCAAPYCAFSAGCQPIAVG